MEKLSYSLAFQGTRNTTLIGYQLWWVRYYAQAMKSLKNNYIPILMEASSKSPDCIISPLISISNHKIHTPFLLTKLLTVQGKWVVSAHSASHPFTHSYFSSSITSTSCYGKHVLLNPVCLTTPNFSSVVVQIILNSVDHDLHGRPNIL